MTNRPNQFPDFALLDRQDPILNAPNVVTPDASHIDYGWAYAEPAQMNWMNWIHRYSSLWIRYLDERLNNPEEYGVATLPSPSDPSVRRFVYVTDDIGGQTPAYRDGTNWRRFSDGAIVSLI